MIGIEDLQKALDTLVREIRNYPRDVWESQLNDFLKLFSVFQKDYDLQVHVPRKQLDDFLLSNDRTLLEMFCQQGPPSKHWIETKGQFWEGWQACNKSVKDFFAQELLEAQK